MTVSRHRRAFVTIQLGSILDQNYAELAKKSNIETPMNMFYQELKKIFSSKIFRAGAFALEVGSKTQRCHIQGYVELKQPRSWQWFGNTFGTLNTCFNTVYDAQGSWDYCSRTGRYSEKEGVLETHVFGEPVLHGASESKADLKKCVSWIQSGLHPTHILREAPYAYTVHCQRIWTLWNALQQLEKYGKVLDPNRR